MPTVSELGEPAHWHSIQLQRIAGGWIGLAGRLGSGHKAGESLQGQLRISAKVHCAMNLSHT